MRYVKLKWQYTHKRTYKKEQIKQQIYIYQIKEMNTTKLPEQQCYVEYNGELQSIESTKWK